MTVVGTSKDRQVTLNPELGRDLQAQKLKLVDRISELQQQIEAINLLLKSSKTSAGALTWLLADGPGHMSVREAISHVLRDVPTGLKTGELYREVLQRGIVRPGGKTPLRNLVNNDLWRMKDRGEVQERNGVYRLTKKGQARVFGKDAKGAATSRGKRRPRSRRTGKPKSEK